MGKKIVKDTPPSKQEAGSSAPEEKDLSMGPPEEVTPYTLLAKEGLLSVKRNGRPPADVDPYHVELLASVPSITKDIICLLLGIHVATLNRRFSEAYEKGNARAKAIVGARQLHFAFRGSPALLIWLGKQMLGQRDNLDLGRGDAPGDREGEEYTREELLAIVRRGDRERKSGEDRNGRGRGQGDPGPGRGDGKPPRLH